MKLPVFAFFLFLLAFPLNSQVSGQDSLADRPIAQITDDSALRSSFAKNWILETPNRVLFLAPALIRLSSGEMVEVRVEGAASEFSVVFARGRRGQYPGWIQGSWSFVRSKSDGSLLRVRMYPRSDPNTWVEFTPFGKDKCRLDVVLRRGLAVQALPVPVAFSRLVDTPWQEILTALGPKFPSRYFEPVPDMYRDSRTLIGEVRERLPEINFRDDGAIDENGDYVFINSLAAQDGEPGLNCSGFAKWLVDGLLRPITGKRLSVGPLKEAYGSRGSSTAKIWEEARDPYFGLDWTRNLAAAAISVQRAPSYARIEEIEVRRERIISVITQTGALKPYSGFHKDAGFAIDGLEAMLYTLAVDEPGMIYLASVNEEMAPAPRLRQHFHVAVLVPYFTETGYFDIAVFESAEETTFRSFLSLHPGCLVNLVRIPVETSFEP